jgi:hypothetical protein
LPLQRVNITIGESGETCSQYPRFVGTRLETPRTQETVLSKEYA